MDHATTFPKGGGATVDNIKLTDEQVGAMVQGLLMQGKLDHYATPGGHETIEVLCERAIACHKAGDRLGAVAALGDLVRFFMADCGMTGAPAIQAGFVPDAQAVPELLRQGAQVVHDFPLEAHNARRDPEEVKAQADELAAQVKLTQLLAVGYQTGVRNAAAGAQEGDAWVRRLLVTVETAETGNPRLAEAAAPLHRYVDVPVLKGQDTKRQLERARQETAEQVTATVTEGARKEAEAQVKRKLDTRLSDLLDE